MAEITCPRLGFAPRLPDGTFERGLVDPVLRRAPAEAVPPEVRSTLIIK
jgi:hypothetical protein